MQNNTDKSLVEVWQQQNPRVSVNSLLPAGSSVFSVMMATKRLDHFQVTCEWASCEFRGCTMEELSDHMSLHLKDYLGDGDALEELGE